MNGFFSFFFSRDDNCNANDNSVVLSKDDTDLISISRCGRCFDLYTVHAKAAITIPCGHTFCNQCIEETNISNYITCSKCNVETFIRFDSARRNVALTQLLEKLDLLDEPTNHHILGKSDEDILVFQKNDTRLLELAECCICTEIYNKDIHAPITAICGHTFCAACVQRFYAFHQSQCFVCRTTFGQEIKSCAKDETLMNLLAKLDLSEMKDVEKKPVKDTFKHFLIGAILGCCVFGAVVTYVEFC